MQHSRAIRHCVVLVADKYHHAKADMQESVGEVAGVLFQVRSNPPAQLVPLRRCRFLSTL